MHKLSRKLRLAAIASILAVGATFAVAAPANAVGGEPETPLVNKTLTFKVANLSYRVYISPASTKTVFQPHTLNLYYTAYTVKATNSTNRVLYTAKISPKAALTLVYEAKQVKPKINSQADYLYGVKQYANPKAAAVLKLENKVWQNYDIG